MISPIQPGAMPGLTLKAWVQFQGSSGTVRKASGVTSVTFNSVGNYTVNLTAGAVATTNYSVKVDGLGGAVFPFCGACASQTTASFLLNTGANGSLANGVEIWVGIYE